MAAETGGAVPQQFFRRHQHHHFLLLPTPLSPRNLTDSMVQRSFSCWLMFNWSLRLPVLIWTNDPSPSLLKPTNTVRVSWNKWTHSTCSHSLKHIYVQVCSGCRFACRFPTYFEYSSLLSHSCHTSLLTRSSSIITIITLREKYTLWRISLFNLLYSPVLRYFISLLSKYSFSVSNSSQASIYVFIPEFQTIFSQP